jgi:NADPH:quinone reductase-like Zn-dependent oxidoreductase
MRAHVLRKYGKSNDVLAFGERPPATLGAADVRIEVGAVALNPVDLKTRVGEPKLLLPFSPPFVLGSDLAGTVTETGPAVTSLKVGDAVYACTGMDRMGAFAESVVLPAERVTRRPANMSPEEAACLPLPGLCALAALDAGAVGSGSRILIHGAAGGVGGIARQLAQQRGAEVYVSVSARDMARMTELPASHVIDRTRRLEEVVRGLDFVFDTVGGDALKRSWGVIRQGGVIASLHVPPPAEVLIAAGLRAPWILKLLLPLVTRGPRVAAAKVGARLAPILTVPGASRLARITEAAEGPGLRVSIDRVLPFEALGEGLEALGKGGLKGRIVLSRNPGARHAGDV